MQTKTSWHRRSWWLYVCFALIIGDVLGQGKPDLVIFDEDDAAGIGYYDASYAFRSTGSQLTLGGPGGDKLLIDNVHARSGSQSGLLQWRSAPTGNWRMFVATPGWAVLDASGYDSVQLYLNGPSSVAAADLPRFALESGANASTPFVPLGGYLASGVDADSTTWQRVIVPLSAFQPYGGFSLSQFKDVNFTQGVADDVTHTLWFDNVRVIGPPDTTRPSPARHVVTRAGDRTVVLHWDAASGATGYYVYRALSRSGPFVRQGGSAPIVPLAYLDLNVSNGGTYYYSVNAVNSGGLESPPSDTASAEPAAFASDVQFLDHIEQLAVDYFWYEANPANGLVRDRNTLTSPSSIAATGFGLTALCIGVDRGWISREAARDRVRTTLNTFWLMPQGTATQGTNGFKGFFYHFLKMNTATRNAGAGWDSELSSIDTALLLAGILDAKQYFDRADTAEARIRTLADSIFNRVDWVWMTNGGGALTLGWSPEGGFLPYRWSGYCEAMIMNLMAIGASAQALPASVWTGWTSTYQWQTHYGYSFVTFPPLFGHQTSHSWIDFRSTQDAYMRGKGITYAENSRRATLAQREYCIANPAGHTGYGPNLWGITACDDPHVGYLAHGAPPAQDDNGTLSAAATASSMPFTPEVSIPALRNMYDLYRTAMWTPYGFSDAFNLKANWFDPEVIGFDQGTTALMIENYRSGSVWARFMKEGVIQAGLQRSGFTPTTDVGSGSGVEPGRFALEQNYPNPFNAMTVVSCQLPVAGRARLVVFDMLGRVVAVLMDEQKPAGRTTVRFDGSSLAGGTYFARLQVGAQTAMIKLLLVK